MILAQIIEKKREELKAQKENLPLIEIQERLKDVSFDKKHNFKHNISRPHQINLIAEVKKSSPSKGIIRDNFDPIEISRVYQANGAAAISVLTEKEFFGGSLEHLELIKKEVTLPILRKDFIIDEYQIYESRLSGADSILFIADILAKEELFHFSSISNELGMDVVVEVHSEEDLEKALSADAQIVGINNRDLHSFEVNIETTSRLKRFIPKDKILISESGIRSYEDVMFLKSLEVNAVLIGEALLKSEDIASRIKEIMGY